MAKVSFVTMKTFMTPLEMVTEYPDVFDAAIEQRNKELAQQTTNTGSPKLPADCGECPLQRICKRATTFGGAFCLEARSQLRAGA